MNISRIPWKRVLRSNFFIPRTFPSFYSCKKYYSARASRDYLKKWLGGGLNPKHEEIAAFDDDFEALSTENLVSHTRNHSSETKENHKPVLWKINGASFLADPMKDIINLNGNTAVVVQIEDLDSLTITMLSQIRSTIEVSFFFHFSREIDFSICYCNWISRVIVHDILISLAVFLS